MQANKATVWGVNYGMHAALPQLAPMARHELARAGLQATVKAVQAGSPVGMHRAGLQQCLRRSREGVHVLHDTLEGLRGEMVPI